MNMRMICNTAKNRLLLLICLLTFFLVMPFKVSAAEQIDINAEASLTIQYTHENKPLSGAPFTIYRVADVAADGTYTLTGDFKDYPVSLQSPDSDVLRQLAFTLDGYVKRDDLTPLDNGQTDASGKLTFPVSQSILKPGLYLVIGQPLKAEGYIYNAEPFLISLPCKSADSSSLNYHPAVQPKYNQSPDTPSDTITRKVLKVWKDDGHKDARPIQIEVQLLKDGDIYDTVTLTQDNNWRFTWDNLDQGSNWTVVEKEVSNYKVSVTQEGITFVITNTYEVPDTPSTPVTPSAPDTSVKLPQTGSLWWPVPWLLACGVLLLGMGIRKNRSEQDVSFKETN